MATETILTAESWGALASLLLLQTVEAPLQGVLVRSQTSIMENPRLTPWERRRELLALLLMLDELDARPSGLLDTQSR